VTGTQLHAKDDVMSTVIPLKPMQEAPTALPSRPERPLLRLTGISKVFTNGVTALTDVDLNIGPGEFVSLLGPSGCGKSTMLKMIAGLIAPTAGLIDWPQSSYDSAGTPERSLGFVFQEPTLLPWRTVAANVQLPLMLKGVDKKDIQARVEDALAQVGLSAFADSYPRQLSGGMKMRVSIARALVTRPQILLMDEPFAALDEITRNKLNNDLLGLFAKKGLTVIFVTHSVYESVYLSSRIVVMSARPGRVTADIPIVVSQPRDEDYRMSSLYNDRCRTVSAALRGAMSSEQAT
jgi:NitT/TauT family transport system ATP-binding protein